MKRIAALIIVLAACGDDTGKKGVGPQIDLSYGPGSVTLFGAPLQEADIIGDWLLCLTVRCAEFHQGGFRFHEGGKVSLLATGFRIDEPPQFGPDGSVPEMQPSALRYCVVSTTARWSFRDSEIVLDGSTDALLRAAATIQVRVTQSSIYWTTERSTSKLETFAVKKIDPAQEVAACPGIDDRPPPPSPPPRVGPGG